MNKVCKPKISKFKDDICIGCGVCEDVCNFNTLEIKLKDDSHFEPFIKNECKQCSICEKTCILTKDNFLQYKEPQKSFKAYDKDLDNRIKSASGGMLTLVAKFLLDTKQVDGIVTVVFKNGEFNYEIVTDLKELDKCRGSVYMPIKHNSIWKKLKEFNGTVAFIGTPCWCEVAYDLRNSRKLENIKFIMGIVCGHMPSKRATFNFIENNYKGINLNEIEDIKYRGNGWPGGGFIKFKNNEVFKFNHTDIWNYKNMSSSYTYNNACSICSDLWGTKSDISFADYWNPKYMKEGKGYSLVNVYTNEIGDILNNIKLEQLAYIEQITIEDALSTQLLPIYIKKYKNSYRRQYIFNNKKLNTQEKFSTYLEITLERLLKSQKYNSIFWKILNKIIWKNTLRKSRKINESNYIKSL